MTQLISVALKTTGVLAIVAGQVADPAGNLWNLPNPVNVPSGGLVTVTATADAQNPNAEYPGSNVALTIENPQAGWLSAKTPDRVTPVIFVTNFPEFAATATYPVATIQFQLDIGYKQVNAAVWQDEYDLGVQLYAAHLLVLEAQAARTSKTGGLAGIATGVINNKSVDKVSTGFDTITASELDAGHWNLTIYGKRFIRMCRLFGAGGIQL